MPFALVGFPKQDLQPMKSAFALMARASAKARKELESGNLDQYRVWFETQGTKHLMKVASVVKDIDETIRNKKVQFVYAGARAHRGQQHVCGNASPLPKGVLAQVKGKSTALAGK